MARLDDGHKTTVAFALASTVKFYAKQVTPPSIDGGGPVDTTTMLNVKYRTKAPKKLITLGTMTLTAAYDPEVYQSVVSTLINKNGLITVNFPDLSSLAFYGWVNSFTPGELTEGEQPTASVTIECSNQNNAGAETDPVYDAPGS